MWGGPWTGTGGEDAELRRPKVTGSLRPSREGKRREGFKEWAWRGVGNCLGDSCSDVGVELPLILMHPKPSHGK